MNLDVMLARRKMRLGELAARVGITVQNLSVLKAGRARAIRFSTLDAICRELACEPGDILEYVPGDDPDGDGPDAEPDSPDAALTDHDPSVPQPATRG